MNNENNNLNEEELNEENKKIDLQENLAEINTTSPKIEVKTPKFPTFPNQNRFGKGSFNNNFNNRQRPGRAASRGR